ncbi:MAG: hypothetical protein KF705_09665 [Phycisphaeraceae bacterium]|nr:hypothetical protein [Phycisphaeraceae bacterium]
MTGWKIGWAIGPAGLVAGVRAAHQFLTFAVSTPMQIACAEAIRPGGPGTRMWRRWLRSIGRDWGCWAVRLRRWVSA